MLPRVMQVLARLPMVSHSLMASADLRVREEGKGLKGRRREKAAGVLQVWMSESV